MKALGWGVVFASTCGLIAWTTVRGLPAVVTEPASWLVVLLLVVLVSLLLQKPGGGIPPETTG